MPTILTTILALIAAAPQAYSQILALWNLAKSGFSASDQASVDAVLAVLNPKLDTDVGQLNIDANTGARG